LYKSGARAQIVLFEVNFPCDTITELSQATSGTLAFVPEKALNLSY
jgi:hypothetical protein